MPAGDEEAAGAAMEPAGTALAQLMRQRMSPVVMVMPTPRAEETCRKNGLGVVDLLRPFCVLDQINGASLWLPHVLFSSLSVSDPYTYVTLRVLARYGKLHLESIKWQIFQLLNWRLQQSRKEIGLHSSKRELFTS